MTTKKAMMIGDKVIFIIRPIHQNTNSSNNLPVNSKPEIEW